MCRDCRFAVRWRQVYQNETLLVLSCVDLRTKGFQPSCAQNRLAQNQNCIRLGLDRFSEVPINAFTRLFIAILWMVVIYCDVLAMDLISVYFNE